MGTVSTILWYAIPALIVVLTFALKPLRKLLERCAYESVNQSELVEAFHQSATRFLKLSDPKRHAELRDMLLFVGRHMLDGTKLIRLIIFNGRRRADSDADAHNSAMQAFEGLSEDAQHAFGRAVGTALLASSYQSFIKGRFYRSVLRWVLTSPEREVKEPEQVVYSFRKSQHLPMGTKYAA